jgi:hypothetical protein
MKIWYVAAAPLVAVAISLVACDGTGDDAKSDDDRVPTSVTRETVDATAVADVTATAEDNPTAAVGLDQLRAIGDKFRTATFSTVYESGGDTPLRFEIRKDPSRFRLDVSGEREGALFSAITILSDSGSFACFTGAQAEIYGQPPEGACAEITNEDENPLANLLEVFTVDENTRLLGTSARQIAGRAATCYRTANVGVEGTVCFDGGGVLLAIESADSGGISAVAVRVTDTVDDSDFQPPYEVRDVPGFGE